MIASVLAAGCGGGNSSSSTSSGGGSSLSGSAAGAGATSQQAAHTAWIAGFQVQHALLTTRSARAAAGPLDPAELTAGQTKDYVSGEFG